VFLACYLARVPLLVIFVESAQDVATRQAEPKNTNRHGSESK